MAVADSSVMAILIFNIHIMALPALLAAPGALNAVGSIGSSIISGIGSLFGQNRYNKTQLKIARETNAMQERQAQMNRDWQTSEREAQNAWSLDQWNRENAYNSASAQVERFNEAGINPALAMTNGASAGTASSLQSAAPGSAPSMPGFVTPQLSNEGTTQAMNAIGNMAMQVAQILNLSSGTKKNDVESDVLGLQKPLLQYQTEGQRLSNRAKHYEIEALDLANRFNFETMKDRQQQIKLQNDLLSTQAIVMELDADAKRVLNSFLPAQEQAGLILKLRQAAEVETKIWRMKQMTPHEIGLLVAKKKREIAETLYTNAKTAGQEISNEVAQATAGNIVNTTYYNMLQADADSQIRMRDNDYDKLTRGNILNNKVGRLFGLTNYARGNFIDSFGGLLNILGFIK